MQWEGGEHTGVRVELCFVDVLDNLLDGRDGPVPMNASDTSCKRYYERNCVGIVVTDILKLPPTKNWRPMMAVLS